MVRLTATWIGTSTRRRRPLAFLAFTHGDGTLEVVRTEGRRGGGFNVYRRREDGGRPTEVREVWPVLLVNRLRHTGAELCFVC